MASSQGASGEGGTALAGAVLPTARAVCQKRIENFRLGGHTVTIGSDFRLGGLANGMPDHVR